MHWTSLLCAAGTLGVIGCHTATQKPIETVEQVDLERFMGKWYVIANIPTFLEKNAYNAVESYELAENGTVKTTFSYRKGGFEGEVKRYHPTGFIEDTDSNAVWGMQFIWPIKADYRVIYLNEDYTQTVIGRNKRDYVWVMARSPSIPEEDFQRIVDGLDEQGYDVAKLQRVPQKWK
jgi:apolipoprotein D and lipocalin family protein